MAASTVHASSLSSITDIASQPPLRLDDLYENNPPALVLYIARVPGSRDVFLSPMKPRNKIVTAEDVESSLYYVHISCEEDRQIVDESCVATSESDTRHHPAASDRQRSAFLQHNQAAMNSYPSAEHQEVQHPSKTKRIARKPVPPLRPKPSDPPPVPARPLPPIPDNQSPYEDFDPAEGHHQTMSTNTYNGAYEGDSSGPALEVDILTLIRRDPGANQQWNVASIHDPPVQEVSSSALVNPRASHRTKRSGSPLYLDITNPGYMQFISPENAAPLPTIPPPSGHIPISTPFHRRLYIPSSRFADHGYSIGDAHAPDSRESIEIQRTLRDRVQAEAPSTKPIHVDRRSKGYVFTSPWNGMCEFYTGVSGKSLKCRHVLGSSEVLGLSELRFNLPTSAKKMAEPLHAKRSSYFAHHRLRSEDSIDKPTVVIDDNGRIDLELGQEWAGGGFGGKQAKLGKLIIEPAGLKMLDLLVAANLGLWWRAYERS